MRLLEMWNLLVLYIRMESNKPKQCLDAPLGWILLTFRQIETYGKLKLPGAGIATIFYLLSYQPHWQCHLTGRLSVPQFKSGLYLEMSPRSSNKALILCLDIIS